MIQHWRQEPKPVTGLLLYEGASWSTLPSDQKSNNKSKLQGQTHSPQTAGEKTLENKMFEVTVRRTHCADEQLLTESFCWKLYGLFHNTDV